MYRPYKNGNKKYKVEISGISQQGTQDTGEDGQDHAHHSAGQDIDSKATPRGCLQAEPLYFTGSRESLQGSRECPREWSQPRALCPARGLPRGGFKVRVKLSNLVPVFVSHHRPLQLHGGACGEPAQGQWGGNHWEHPAGLEERGRTWQH